MQIQPKKTVVDDRVVGHDNIIYVQYVNEYTLGSLKVNNCSGSSNTHVG